MNACTLAVKVLNCGLCHAPISKSIMHYFQCDTLDDAIRHSIESIFHDGTPISSSSGDNAEISRVAIEIKDPTARLSRTETRGKIFSCLGEFLWYLSEEDDLTFIEYYITKYRQYADGSGAYGPRLFNMRGQNQIHNVLALLRQRPFSRQAAIQIFQAEDISEQGEGDVPCTCTIQLLVRDDALNMITYMRSNDVYLGLPHDVFSFTMFQELVARTLSVKLGTYMHVVGSLHLYNRDRDAAREFLEEGWQHTTVKMPPMPEGDPWESVRILRTAEQAVRTSTSGGGADLEAIDPYWADLIRLLKVLRAVRDGDIAATVEIKDSLHYDVYKAYVRGMTD